MVVRNAAEFANLVGATCLSRSSAELIGLEVTQAVQDWSNSVQPLVANKTTLVRAHVRSAQPTDGIGRLRSLDSRCAPE